MLAPLGATSGLEFSQRNEYDLDVAPNGADRLFLLVSIKMQLLRSQTRSAGDLLFLWFRLEEPQHSRRRH
jgi:hypothetical protein